MQGYKQICIENKTVAVNLLFWLVICIVLTSCANYFGIHSHQKIVQPSQFQTKKTLPRQKGGWPVTDWAKQFGDPQLDALIHEALVNNPDLQIAKARIAQARSIAEAKAASMAPAVKWDGTAGVGGTHVNIPFPSYANPLAQGGYLFSLNYTLDFWGKNVSLLKQAIYQEKASRAAYQESRLTIAAAVATTYNQLGYYYDLHNVLRRTVFQRDALSKLSLARLRIGLDSKVPVYLSHNTQALARTQLVDVIGQIQITRQQLGVLLGGGPDRGLMIKRPTLKGTKTPDLPANLPLNLLGRRPDIVMARYQVAASCYGIKNVKAQFYPNVNLIGGGGFLSMGLNHFLLNANAEYLGPAISLPIFDGGVLRARLKEKYAVYEEAVANYNTTLSNAFAEIGTQLTSILSIDNKLITQKEALDAADDAYILAREQHRIGLASQLVALDSELRFFEEQQSRLQLITARRNLQIALIKSLGGGFDTQTHEVLQ